jgi:Holliday junction resolvase RusA-like endonuclease
MQKANANTQHTWRHNNKANKLYESNQASNEMEEIASMSEKEREKLRNRVNNLIIVYFVTAWEMDE